MDAYDEEVANHFPPHVSVVAISCEIIEGYDVLLCSFATLLAPFVESGTLIYDIFPGLEERIELRLPCIPCFPCLLHSLMLELLLPPPPRQQSKILTCFIFLDSSRPEAYQTAEIDTSSAGSHSGCKN